MQYIDKICNTTIQYEIQWYNNMQYNNIQMEGKNLGKNECKLYVKTNAMLCENEIAAK